ncbi:drug/metabolite transporter (DMT)-like permease [Kitasatospora sp. MAP12-15]|uniref:hypothetical protein n=1 Tax=unclassified Kitasatospora TaxID=2633591 RepID=UPI0024736272|nr:hypothetical protein [Kitasatospora sp. MAP12-44]MDH6108313.1 drug/metabolite transporter (DMT)-like permease [Kitasatospora sp. MAP12-44]
MLLGLVTSLFATLCYGFASVLQARGAQTMPEEDRPGLRLLARVARSRLFLLGTGLDILGFGLVVVTLYRLPLFVVQAVTSASLAVTAAGAVWLLGGRLARRDLIGIAAVVAGLAMLALSSGPEGSRRVGTEFKLTLLAATAAVLLLSLPLAHRRGNAVAAALGLLAGLGFGAVNLAVRVLDHSSLVAMATDAATYALMIGGLGGYLCYALALQRGSVTIATAAVVVGETLVPGLIGVTLLGDRARPGFGWSAVLGFAVAVGGALVLSRFGEIEPARPRPAAGGSRPRGRSASVRRWLRTDARDGMGQDG